MVDSLLITHLQYSCLSRQLNMYSHLVSPSHSNPHRGQLGQQPKSGNSETHKILLAALLLLWYGFGPSSVVWQPTPAVF